MQGYVIMSRQLKNHVHYMVNALHDDVIKWKQFPRYCPFVRGIHRSPMNSPHKGQWRGALMFPLICAWMNSWANNQGAGDLRRHRAHYDVTVMVAHDADSESCTITIINFSGCFLPIFPKVNWVCDMCLSAERCFILIISILFDLASYTCTELTYRMIIMPVNSKLSSPLCRTVLYVQVHGRNSK